MTWEDHLAIAEALMRSGTLEVIQGVSTGSLFNSIVIQPMDLVLLVSRQLVVDVLPKEHGVESKRRISSTYSDYLRAMVSLLCLLIVLMQSSLYHTNAERQENNITDKVSDRSHQHRINLLRQELAVVQDTITTQQELLREMTSRHHAFKPRVPQHQRLISERGTRHNPPHQARSRAYPFHSGFGATETSIAPVQPYDRITSTDDGGIREILYTECNNILSQRLKEFEAYEKQADMLEATVSDLELTLIPQLSHGTYALKVLFRIAHVS
jgi:hypothetical protein